MEAWHFIDYRAISPVFALATTTRRWGLELFPLNLVSIPGYLKDLESKRNTTGIHEEAASLGYSCDKAPYWQGYPKLPYEDWVFDSYKSIEINSTTKVCSVPQSCPNSGCLIVIEGAGKATTGPAHTHIVGLAYGIITLILLAIVTGVVYAFKMGCFQSTPRSYGKSDVELGSRSPDPIQTRIHTNYNPPLKAKTRQPYKIPEVPQNMSKEVARCSDLMRQLYALDIKIWGKQDSIEDEQPEVDKMKRRSAAMFNEIRRTVNSWRTTDDGRWTLEEREQIEEICRIVDHYDPSRYRG